MALIVDDLEVALLAAPGQRGADAGGLDGQPAARVVNCAGREVDDAQRARIGHHTDAVHADGDLELGPSALLQGRVSCGARMRVEEGTVFERLHAPRIEFGPPAESTISTADTQR